MWMILENNFLLYTQEIDFPWFVNQMYTELLTRGFSTGCTSLHIVLSRKMELECVSCFSIKNTSYERISRKNFHSSGNFFWTCQTNMFSGLCNFFCFQKKFPLERKFFLESCSRSVCWSMLYGLVTEKNSAQAEIFSGYLLKINSLEHALLFCYRKNFRSSGNFFWYD